MTTAIAPSLPVIQQAPEQPKTMREEVLTAIQGDDQSLEWKTTMIKVAAISNLVAWIALAIGSMIATGILSPMMLPLTGLGVILLFPVTMYVENQLREYYDQNLYKLLKRKEIRHHYQDLTQMTPVQIQTLMASKGINIAANRLEEIKPLCAFYLFSEKTLAETEEHTQKLRNDAQTDDKEVTRCERIGFLLKMEKAYLHTIISHHPDFAGQITDLGTFQKAEDASFFTFNNRAIHPLTTDDMRRLSIPEMGQRLTMAMN
jgi:hypothetical protein